jgi:hypothetical protein
VSKKRDESGHDIVNELRHTMQRFKQRLTLTNTRFVERYLAGELHLFVHFTGRGVEEYVAHFQRADSTLASRTPEQSSGFDLGRHDAHSLEVSEYVDGGKIRSYYDEQVMLISDIQPMEFPERIVPSLVRLGVLDLVYRGLPLESTLSF